MCGGVENHITHYSSTSHILLSDIARGEITPINKPHPPLSGAVNVVSSGNTSRVMEGAPGAPTKASISIA